jgi:Ca2+-binding RTX toxin-like protein
MATLTDVTTRPSSGLTHIDALLDRGPGWNWLSPSRTVLFYTFDTSAVDPNRASEITGGVTPFNAAQQSAVVSALALMSAITGITFSLTAQASQADLHFAAANLTTPSNAGLASWSNSYSFSGQNIVSYTADAWVYLDNVEFSGVNTTPSVGTVGFEVLLHELGHAMGLKHPFEGPVVMPTALDRTSFTLMSYTDSGGPYSSYRSLDIAALRFLYGDDGLGGPLGQGGTARFLTGSPNGDTLVGTSGDDKFEGGLGNDTIEGGAGTDTAIFSGNRVGYTVTLNGGEVTVVGPDGTDRLTGVEVLKFADESVFVSPGGPAPAGGTVTITGVLRQGSTLTAVPTVTDANGVGTLSLQWQAGSGSGPNLAWTDIAGATGTTFAPVEAQVGLVLRVVARFTDGLGTAETVFGTVSEPVANVNDPPTGTLVINGTASQGQVLSVTQTLADPDGLGALTLQWQSSTDAVTWRDVTGATGTVFTPGEAQVGQFLRVRASYTDQRGTAEAVNSGPTAPVANVNDPPVGAVTITGTPEQGVRLTAVATLTDEDGLGTVRLGWQTSPDGSNWTDLATTGGSLLLDDAVLGQFIRALARYTDGRGTAEAVPSSATGRVLGVREGGAGDDVLQGSAVADRIEGRAGRDTLIGSGGNDQLLGGDGLDTAVYAGPRSRFDVGTRAATVTDRTGTEGSDTLQGVERLRFTDGSLAFDLDGAAGTVARLLGAVFGREAVGNATFAGIGLRLADQGLSSAALAALALQARWGDNVPADTVVHGLYRNLLGIDAPASDLAYWRGTLERGEQTPASLAVLAAGLPLTAELIGLPALTDNGLAYMPPA